MESIESRLKDNTVTWKENKAFHQELVTTLNDRLKEVKLGGGSIARDRHTSRGKMLVRDRIDALLDAGTPFLELSALAGWEQNDGKATNAGVDTGIGRVLGILVMFVANDSTVKGGAYYPLTGKKHIRAQQIAEENHLPCIYLVDLGGAFFARRDEVFPDEKHFGNIFYNQAQMSSKGIPQIAAVMGSCTAGGAYVPAMSDVAVIVEDTGTIFLGGPPLVMAATGEDVTAEELGGADVHTRFSGVADHFAEDDQHALEIVQDIVASLNIKQEVEGNPYYSTARIWDDGILDPAQTRDVLGLALSVVLQAAREGKDFGIFRM